MADLLRAYSKSAQAVEYLITGKGRIKERLLEACQDGFVHIDRKALPSDLKSVYDQIRELVVDRSPPTSGAYRRAVEKLSEDEAQRAATLMHELECRLRAVAK